MDYFKKKNLGIPAGILAAFAVLCGISVYSGGISVAAIIFTAAVFMFEFDANVKSLLKQSLVLGFIGRLVKLIISIAYDILNWFSGAAYAESEGARTVYKVFTKILNVTDDVIGFAFIIAFIILLAAAIKNKAAKVPVIGGTVEGLDNASNACPNCGAIVDAGAGFCTKCGTKMK